MARTAHHRNTSGTGSRPWRAVLLRDLRYSAAGLRAAERERRRPRPQPVTRRVAVYEFARAPVRSRVVAGDAALDERRARQSLRRRLGELMRSQRFDTEVAPARHRHNAVWSA